MSEPAKQLTVPAYRHIAIKDHGGGGKLMPQTFGDVVEFSKIMAHADVAIPKYLRGNSGACMAITMQALRWELDPFLVASKSYSIGGMIAYEAQLVAAVVHTRAPLKTRPIYQYIGDGQDMRCTVSAEFDDGITRSYESPCIADIAVKNSPLWRADPAQQLGYFSIRSFARRYCPEVILGVYTPEEAQTFEGPDRARDVTPRVPLAERLKAAEGGDGFSEQHVVQEIDGAAPTTDSNSGPDGSRPGPDSAPSTAASGPTAAASAPPASGPFPLLPPDAGHPSVDSAADTQLETEAASEGDQAGAAGNPAHDASGAGLPPDWATQYASALRRAQKPASLPKLAAQFWATMPMTWAQVEPTEDGNLAKAIFDAFKIVNADARRAQLRELGVE